jgi:hypothetical protein
MDFKKIPNSNSVGNFFASPPKITDRQGAVTNNKKNVPSSGVLYRRQREKE